VDSAVNTIMSGSEPIGRQLLLLSPLLALVATLLAVVVAPLFAGRGVRPVVTVVLVGLVVTFLAVLRVTGEVAHAGAAGLLAERLSGMLIVDNLSLGYMFILLVFLVGVMWLWWTGSAPTEQDAPEFFILLLGSALGMAMMASSTNLLFIVVAMETASLSSYAIVGFDKKNPVGAEASLKYVVFGGISAAIMLYGISLLYGLCGSLDVAVVARYTLEALQPGGANVIVLTLGLLCFLAGIAFKMSAVPFHFWCPDAFEGAKIEVTTWLSVASKAAGLILLARLALTFCAAAGNQTAIPLLLPLAWVVGILATITCTYGNFCAYKQQSVKRLLAYSSIAHAGYMMMAVTVFVYVDPQRAPTPLPGIGALLTYVVIYLFMNLGAFGVTGLVAWETGSDKLEAFTGLARRAPWLAVPMVICLVSLVGLPPLAGFIGKWWILLALGATGGTLGWLLVLVMVLNTLISLFYYMRIVVRMGLHDTEAGPVRPPVRGVVLVNVCAAALIALFVLAYPLKDLTDRFAQALYLPVVSATQDGKQAVVSGLPLVSDGYVENRRPSE